MCHTYPTYLMPAFIWHVVSDGLAQPLVDKVRKETKVPRLVFMYGPIPPCAHNAKGVVLRTLDVQTKPPPEHKHAPLYKHACMLICVTFQT
mmetsp:Transcript_41481/g.74408  ORF Transcript_41481/g.74408 Transcript_41481/m.74408 type:complete len:91 (+) Transcript_41481:153-425(+)